MQELRVHASDPCRFLRRGLGSRTRLRIAIIKQVSAMEDVNSTVHSPYWGRKSPEESFGGGWRPERRINSNLARQRKRWRRGPSETLALSDNQF